MTEHWKRVSFDDLNTPQEGDPQLVEFCYAKKNSGGTVTPGTITKRRGMVVDLYGTPSIKLYNLPTSEGGVETPPNREYSTFSVEGIVGDITLVSTHPDWVAPS